MSAVTAEDVMSKLAASPMASAVNRICQGLSPDERAFLACAFLEAYCMGAAEAEMERRPVSGEEDTP